jgi:hypothetical protein
MVAVVVYLGLLPALLFSSGEGIRLIPFPETSSGSSEMPAKHGEAGTQYHENATRIFCDAAGQKSPKELDLAYDCPGVLPGLNVCGPFAGCSSLLSAGHSVSTYLPDREFPGISGRAPPLV